MSIPTGGNAFLYELELTVTTELTQAETNPPEEEAVGVEAFRRLHKHSS